MEKTDKTMIGTQFNVFNNMLEGISVYKLIFNDKGEAIDGILEYMNHSTIKSMDLNPENVIGKKGTELYSPDYLKPVFQSINEFLKTGIFKRLELYYPPTDKYFLISGFNMPDGRFAVLRVDITEHKRTEKSLLRAKEQNEIGRKRLEAILETSPAAIIIVEASDGRISYINRRARQLYGIDIEGLDLTDAVSKVKARRADGSDYLIGESPTGRALKGLEVHNEEVIMEHADGTIIPILASAAPIFNSEGDVIAAVAIFEDATEQKESEERIKRLLEESQQFAEELEVSNEELKATTEELHASNEELHASNEELQATTEELQVSNEELHTITEELQVSNEELKQQGDELLQANQALKESEEKFFKIFYSSPVGTVLTDEDGKFTDANKSYLSLTGFRKDELIGYTSAELKIMNAENRDRLMNEVWQKGRVNDVEVEIHTKFGETRNVLTTLESINIGGEKRNLGFVYDITEHKQAEMKQRELSKQRQLALNAAHLGWWHYDPVTEIATYDEGYKKIFGVSGNSRPNKEILKRLHPDDLPGVWAKVEEALDPINPKPYSAKYRIFRDVEDVRWIEAHGMATFEGEGNSRRATSLVGTVEDITRRIKAEDEIQRNVKVLNGINKVFNESLTSKTVEEVVSKCLEVAEELTGSEFSFIGEINENGRLDDRAISPPGWDACTANPEKSLELLSNMEIVSYWGRTIKEEKSQIVNDPDSDPDRRGLPEGHPPITSFLGVPLKQGGKTIGMIALANKKGGYIEEDKEDIEALSLAFVEALMRKRAEIQLNETLNTLEEKVEERTIELEEAYQSLKESELKAKERADLLDVTHEAIFVRDMNDKVTFWNKGAEELYGRTKKEALGKDVYDLLKTEFLEPLEQIKNDVLSKDRWDGELIRERIDGTKINILSRWSLQRDRNNRPIGFLEVNVDITERKKAENEISQKNKILDGINTIFRATITNIDEEEFGKKCLAVCEELTGSKISFMGEVNEHGRFDSIAVSKQGWKACSMVKEEGAESVDDNIIRGIRGRAIEERKVLIFNDPTNSPYWSGLPEGHYQVNSFLGAPLIYRDEVIGLIALANKKDGYSKEDIEVMEVITTAITESLMHYRALNQLEENQNELKETINELGRSNKELQSFAYITSHDLQEPLRTMGNYAGLLKHRYQGQLDNDADDFLEYIASGAARMKDMVQGLLDYSRVGTQGKEFTEFSAEEALDSALTNLKSAIEECHTEVTHDPLPEIVADESQISRVFQNLIGNALKFRKKGIPPKIHISARNENGEYVFSVSDNGIGIEEEYIERIFEVFKRLHSIGEYQGVGIGLAIVKRVIERHGGRIWVESEFGVGSTFYFTIPTEID